MAKSKKNTATPPIIDDETAPGLSDLLNPLGFGHGYDPTQKAAHPVEMAALPSEIKLIPRSEWSARIKERKEQRATGRDLRDRLNDGQKHKSLDQNGQGYCFPAGTRVRMADGTFKPIESISLTDKVVTAEGNVGRVRQCHAREFIGSLVTIKAHGHGHLRATPEHPVLTRRGYVPFGKVRKGDWVAIPKHTPEESRVVLRSTHVTGVGRRLKNAPDGRAVFEDRIPAAWEAGVKHVPEVISLTRGVGRIFGLWLAEGHVDSPPRVVWSFGTHERETLVQELVNLLRDEWGVEATVQPGPAADTVTQVVLRGKMWCQLFSSLCGEGAARKRVHADLMCGPREFLDGLFSGWMDGDGCIKTPNQKRGYDHRVACGATVSHDLALAMYDVANRLGLSPVISRQEPQVNRYARACRPVWYVQYVLSRSDRRPDFRVVDDPGVMWRRVREIIQEPFTGTVYNIGVEGDNSYVAEGVGVHNCWAYSVTQSVMFARGVAHQPYSRLSAHAVACKVKNFRDQGGWCGLSAEFIRRNGVPSVEEWPEKSMSRSHDTEETWAAAKENVITEDFVDLTKPVYDQNLTLDQVVSCIFGNVYGAVDYNFWAHSVMYLDVVEVEPGSFGLMILNSWTDAWGDEGIGILRGSKAIPDGAVATRVVTGG